MDDKPDLAARVAALEEAVGLLQKAGSRLPLERLRNEAPAGGSVQFGGTVDMPGPSRVDWQMGHPAHGLLHCDWTEIAHVLSALGHPIRLSLLQTVLNGTSETASLAETLCEGTTGQLHHHLRELTATGWLRNERRGRYSIPPDRVVPLLVIVAAAGGPQTGQDAP
ncbi:ArsR/SmtB family transcription factor [Roseinatronobacter alkalisoli]|uniref:Helix-turn-helix domain-containing protein n=1 Tax=Roseinatronobacter alkalisoli TaxID=3028235 RepID=A0ABT5T6V9_9RHOB|nr:helix-turn-helix domain-containing protein [Roseinatronobacter sp. HJB301]MDD7970860.1 helix-turn-helix domain-containing protein [Roseinatronobacter sp. HJB301]